MNIFLPQMNVNKVFKILASFCFLVTFSAQRGNAQCAGGPIITATPTNPSGCGNADGSITISGLIAGTVYDINYTFISFPATIVKNQTADGSGKIVIPNIKSGAYTNISASLAGNSCTGNAIVVTLADPLPPAITTTVTNPSSCSGTNGSIIISGLGSGSNYSVVYNNGITDVTLPVTAANASGQITIGNLKASVYTKISATLNNCKSNVVTETLINTGSLSITVVEDNPTSCGATDGKIVISGLSSTVGYKIIYKLDGVVQPTVNQTANANGEVALANPAVGSYSEISVSLPDNSCPASSSGVFVNNNAQLVMDAPNIITPNHDDKNEVFHIPALLLDYCDNKFENIEIFNRWGTKVFTSKDRNFKWDAEGEADGIYFYYVKYTNAKYKSWLQVIR